jgi:hypothetical protein
MSDDKLVCSVQRPSREERAEVLRFFRFYARCKLCSISSCAARVATRARAGAKPPRQSHAHVRCRAVERLAVPF